MLSKVISAAVTGIDASIVTVEVDQSNGIPSFIMTGYLNARVLEAGERVRTAMKNVGCPIPGSKIVVNVSPASIRKTGTMLDLPIAVGILADMGMIDSKRFHETLIVGELSLDGSIHGIPGVLPMVCEAHNHHLKQCIIPAECVEEARLIQGIEVVGVRSLKEVMDLINHGWIREEESVQKTPTEESIGEESDTVSNPEGDFAEICGQYLAKRAILIAAAGRHNLLMSGAPGSGKTMLASRISGILPPLTREEIIEVSKIYSVAGNLHDFQGKLPRRPFRSPHHTITQAALLGGGKYPIPGEITLAHQGVLFLDELTKFKSGLLESLRQPLEERKIHIVRNGILCQYPADFMLVAAMNPCKCGFYPDRNRCQCTPYEIMNHFGKLSRPFLDRFDLSVQVDRPEYEEIAGMGRKLKTSLKTLQNGVKYDSKTMGQSVLKAEMIQRERYIKEGIHFNSQLSAKQIKQFCPLDEQGEKLMEMAYEKYHLSARGYGKILKVARTIADLEHKEQITVADLSEAICFRQMNMEESAYGTR
ncbi:MAG: YifB family Mg chelatase-like AAA ATPase [Lachnospiraceae bacterium]